MGTASSGRPSETHQLQTHGLQSPPIMPDDLVGEHAVGLWREAVEALPHVLRPIDYATLRLACMAYQRALDLLDAADDKQAAAMMRVFESLGAKLGLHPHARRIVKPVAGEESAEAAESLKFEKWLSKGRGRA